MLSNMWHKYPEQAFPLELILGRLRLLWRLINVLSIISVEREQKITLSFVLLSSFLSLWVHQTVVSCSPFLTSYTNLTRQTIFAEKTFFSGDTHVCFPNVCRWTRLPTMTRWGWDRQGSEGGGRDVVPWEEERKCQSVFVTSQIILGGLSMLRKHGAHAKQWHIHPAIN